MINGSKESSSLEPRCRYFGRCGGCSLQDLSPGDQLTLKHHRLSRVFATLPDPPAVTLVALANPWRYRNKAEFSFGESDGRLILGYHAAGSYHRVVDLEDCLLLPEHAMWIVRNLHAAAAQTGLPAYHPRTHQGFFRHLIVRASQSTGKVLVGLMTTPENRERIEPIARQLLEQQAELSGFYLGHSQRLADVAVPEALWLLAGSGFLEEQFGPLTVRFDLLSFLQAAGPQAHPLYESIVESLTGGPHDVAWDLYCGIGLVGLYLARQFRTVYAIDVASHHIALAATNAALNQVTNLVCHTGTVETVLADRRFWLGQAKPDAIVVDPPRAGLQPTVLSSLLAARPRRIVYVSCNPDSLVRDLRGLLTSYPRYRLTRLQGFDLFPQTAHVEILAVLERSPQTF